MKKQVVHVMVSGIETEELTVRHVRQPCQRVPVRHVVRSESPFNIFRSKARCHVRVIRNIGMVIVTYKVISQYAPVCNDCGQTQNQINPNRPIVLRYCHITKANSYETLCSSLSHMPPARFDIQRPIIQTLVRLAMGRILA